MTEADVKNYENDVKVFHEIRMLRRVKDAFNLDLDPVIEMLEKLNTENKNLKRRIQTMKQVIHNA